MTARRSRCQRRRQGSEIPCGREILRGEFENSIKIERARQRKGWRARLHLRTIDDA